MKRGFTLTELLAVIIILGIIALITIPLVLRLINNARRDSAIASANSYVKQVKSALLANSSRVSLKNETCIINEEDDKITCNGEVLEVDIEGNSPTCGKIVFENSKLSYYLMNMSGYRVIKHGEKGEEDATRMQGCEETETPSESSNPSQPEGNKICTSEQGNGSTELGTKYLCEVKDNEKYNFYVLSIDGDKVNLILDRNICYDGSLSGGGNYCTYPWNQNYDNLVGPINALDVLYNGTSSWNKIGMININYEDESRIRYGNGYESVVSEGSVTQIFSSYGDSYSIGNDGNPLRARLPKLEELENANCNEDEGSCPSWLVNNLRYYDVNGGKYNEVNSGKEYWDINGYWTMASCDYDTSSARSVSYAGNIVSYYIDDIVGVRPVITVPITELK